MNHPLAQLLLLRAPDGDPGRRVKQLPIWASLPLNAFMTDSSLSPQEMLQMQLPGNCSSSIPRQDRRTMRRQPTIAAADRLSNRWANLAEEISQKKGHASSQITWP
jgi:hypothetical protein